MIRQAAWPPLDAERLGGQAADPDDDRIGRYGFPDPGTTRMACLAAANSSVGAVGHLEQFCGARLEHGTNPRPVRAAADRLPGPFDWVMRRHIPQAVGPRDRAALTGL